MRKRKFLSMLLITAMTVSFIGTGNGPLHSSDVEAKASENNQQYILKVKDDSDFKKLKGKVKKDNKRIIRHNDADEKYLEDNNTIVVELTEDEAEEYAKKEGVVIEKEQDLVGSSTGQEEGRELTFTPIEVPMDQYETEEYSDDPYAFEPCDEIKKEEDKTEIVPWNIFCVAGVPHENKYKGKHVKIAVVDSGIDTHDELNTKGWVDFSDEVKGYKPTDNSGHGTAMAGVIAGRINGFGIEGIASEAELYSVKVLDAENKAPISAVVKALEWCIENDMDIINMSFGMDTDSQVLQDIVQKVNAAGILMIAAAGNNADDIQYPASYPEVISVGAVKEDLSATDFSDNTKVDLVAPGENAQSIGYVGSYTKVDGTSVAAAHVTGIAAVTKSAKKSISSKQLKQALLSSGIELEDGSKLVNYENAVHAAKKEKLAEISVAELQEETKELAEDKEAYVDGSWLTNMWKDNSEISGHKSMINHMDSSYFRMGASNDTMKQHYKWIVAEAAYQTDALERMSASKSGNWYRDANGVIGGSTSTPKCYSPYHGKSEYTLTEVLQHMRFLYELSRRHLVLFQDPSFNATDYTGNDYYGVTLNQKMKRRIIEDLNVLHDTLVANTSRPNIDMNSRYSKGYMIMGVFLHLVQDMEAHRSLVYLRTLFSTVTPNSYHTSDYLGASMMECRVNGNNIKGNPDTGNSSYGYPCTILCSQLASGATMPIIRLKDYLKDNISIVRNGNVYVCNAGEAYEDNPYFGVYRFSMARTYTLSYVEQMYEDTGATSSNLNSYFTNSSNPLYQGTYTKRTF